jgi:uncharacterized membrane protein
MSGRWPPWRNVLQLVGSWIALLIILLVKRDSRFVSVHALQALLLQILHMIVIAVFVVLWFGTMFLTMAHQGGANQAAPPIAFLVVFPLFLLGFMGQRVLMLVIAIVYGMKAGRGEWAEYPSLGTLSKKILKIGPHGAVAP